VIAPAADDEPATKPGGDSTTTPPAKKHTVCYIYPPLEFEMITGIKSDVGGMVCFKV